MLLISGFVIVFSIAAAFCLSGKFDRGLSSTHKTVQAFVDDKHIKVNSQHIYSKDFFSKDLKDEYKYIEDLFLSCSDIFVVKATNNIDIKGNIKQKVVVESLIKGSAIIGDTVDIIYNGYFTKSDGYNYVGFYNQNFMQQGNKYIVFANQYSAYGKWYITISGVMQSYFNVSNDNLYYIYNEHDFYGDGASYEFFVDSKETGEQIRKLKDFLLKKYMN